MNNQPFRKCHLNEKHEMLYERDKIMTRYVHGDFFQNRRLHGQTDQYHRSDPSPSKMGNPLWGPWGFKMRMGPQYPKCVVKGD